MSRAYTKEEVRDQFLDHLKTIARYWDNVEGKTAKEKLNGAMFSVLNIFDGTSMGLPAFDLVVRPHPSDKEYHIEEGENYYEDGQCINEGMLHDLWYRKD